jgi:hypothetical protein
LLTTVDQDRSSGRVVEPDRAGNPRRERKADGIELKADDGVIVVIDGNSRPEGANSCPGLHIEDGSGQQAGTDDSGGLCEQQQQLVAKELQLERSLEASRQLEVECAALRTRLDLQTTTEGG